MFVERDWRRMSGRWFTGAYDELGIDVTLHRADVPQITGVYPIAVRAGTAGAELTVFGANLPAGVAAAQVDFGPDVEVTEIIAAGPESIRVRVDVAAGAAVGKRDLFVGGIARPQALAVFDAIDAVRVTPGAGMARVGGAVAPKQLVQFEAIGVSYGADDEEGTDDDMELGALDVTWGLEEYAATFDDDDIEFVGTLDDNGLFTPAIDGPNPERRGNRNNVGDVWVVATFPEAGLARPLRGRAHLVVTVPIYLMEQRWETRR
jgi:quinohemoprotein amine dehydrogenase